MHDENGAAFGARLLTSYGQLAAELDDSTDPAQQAWLHARLAELDTILDAAADRAAQSAWQHRR